MFLHSLKNINEVIIITLKKLMPPGIRAKVSQIQAVNTFLVFLFGAFIFLNSDAQGNVFIKVIKDFITCLIWVSPYTLVYTSTLI